MPGPTSLFVKSLIGNRILTREHDIYGIDLCVVEIGAGMEVVGIAVHRPAGSAVVVMISVYVISLTLVLGWLT